MMKTVYLHIPFCKSKCFYCSFIICVSHKKRRDRYCLAVCEEIRTHKRQRIDCIYFGGGTPSQLTTTQLGLLVGALQKQFFISGRGERTIEANPDDLTEAQARDYVKLGFNRVSLGIQTFQDHRLKLLGRCHTANEAYSAFRFLREAGIHNVNVDLITGLPGQTPKDLLYDLQQICALDPEHVSIYALSVEKHSLFFARRVGLPNEKRQIADFMTVKKVLEAHGYQHYEVSNFAKPGFYSRHNKNYWLGGDYIGLGLAAHSHRQGVRSWNASRMMEYLNAIEGNGGTCVGQERLTKQECLIESIILGLRLTEGVNISLLTQRFGVALDLEREKTLQGFIQQGFLKQCGSKIAVTDRGMLVLDELSARLI